MVAINCITILYMLFNLILQYVNCYVFYQQEDNHSFIPVVNNVLEFMFSEEQCVMVFNSESPFSNVLLKQIYTKSNIGALVLRPDTKIIPELHNCKGITIICDNIACAKNKLLQIPRWYGYNILCIAKGVGDFKWSRRDAGEIVFGDANGIFVTIGGQTNIYARVQPKRDLEKITKLIGRWKQMGFELNNFLGRPIKVGIFNCNIFASLGPINEHNVHSWVSGLDAVVIKEATKKLNLTWVTLVPPEQNKWGRLVNNTYDGGILKMLQESRVDMAACGIYASLSMLETGLEISTPLGTECLKFCVPRPRPITADWRSLFIPFNYEVWICTAVFVVFSTISFFIFCKISSHWCKQNKEFTTIGACLFEVAAIFMLGRGLHQFIGSLRQLVFMLVLLTFILNTCFSSGLFSQLTMPRYSNKMDTLEELVENDYYWITSTFPDSTLLFDLDNPVELAWSRRHMHIDDYKDIVPLLEEDPRVALIGFQLEKALYIDEELPNVFVKDYEAMSECVRNIMFSFGYRKGSPYVQPIDMIILRLQGAGIVQHQLRHTLNKITPSKPFVHELLMFEKSHPKAHQPLALKNVIGVFDIFIVGTIISILGFMFELIFNSLKTKKKFKINKMSN